MTAPQGLSVITIGNLGTPEALGREIFERSREGVFPGQVVNTLPDLPPVRSLVDCSIMSAGCTLPEGVDNPGQAAKEAVANAAHALTAALESGEAFGRAADFYRDMWSKGSLLDSPAPGQARAIAACHDAFEAAATRALEAAPQGSNELATALTWAILGDGGQRFVGLAEQLQSSAALDAEVKADLVSAIGLMRH